MFSGQWYTWIAVQEGYKTIGDVRCDGWEVHMLHRFRPERFLARSASCLQGCEGVC